MTITTTYTEKQRTTIRYVSTALLMAGVASVGAAVFEVFIQKSVGLYALSLICLAVVTSGFLMYSWESVFKYTDSTSKIIFMLCLFGMLFFGAVMAFSGYDILVGV